jgi:hypothetical protein
MNRLLLGLMLVWLCAPAMVRAARLNSQLRVGGGWDNNVNNTERQEESDTFGLLGGRFTLESEQNVPFTWSLAYEGLYQLYQQESRLDRYWQTFRGEFERPLGPATRISGVATLRQTYDTGSGQFSTGASSQGTVTRGNDRIDRAELTLGLDHQLGLRWSGALNANYRAIRYNARFRADFEAIGGTAALSYALSQRLRLGGGLSLTQQSIDSTSLSPSQTTDFANAFLSWSYVISPLWNLQSRMGPTWIRAEDSEDPPLIVRNIDPTTGASLGFPLVPLISVNRQLSVIDARPGGGCPSAGAGGRVLVTPECNTIGLQFIPVSVGRVDSLVLPNPFEFDTGNDSLTTFANISLVRRGESSTWSTTLSRSDGGNLGGRTSTIVTTLASSFDWKPAERWRLAFSGHYFNRESATDTQQVLGVFVPLDPTNPPVGIDPRFPEGTAVRALGPLGQAGERRVVEADNAVDIDTWVLRFQATREITRQLNGRLLVVYRDQNDKSAFTTTANSFEDLTVTVSLTYTFDSIAF